MADEEPDVAVEATEEVAEVEIEMSVLDALKTVRHFGNGINRMKRM
jgi:hypothetical protein